ncbi:hypothetical protein DWU99_15820 [Dyella psychrodurans]|uniref:Uncharacterized protein n=1 Tax=Dyella psychrodurans TaxID=1927960 RepID=A0A370X0T7_9GAMM|nr:hypothetical protein DWU99_15820 [Dyella psychrodurans]
MAHAILHPLFHFHGKFLMPWKDCLKVSNFICLLATRLIIDLFGSRLMVQRLLVANLKFYQRNQGLRFPMCLQHFHYPRGRFLFLIQTIIIIIYNQFHRILMTRYWKSILFSQAPVLLRLDLEAL